MWVIVMKKMNLRTWLLTLITVGAFALCAVCVLPVRKPERKTDTADSGADTDPTVPPLAHIVIDPGHGGNDHGASGNMTGTPEDVLNLDVSKKIASELECRGIKVTLTRYTDDAVAPTKKEDMKERRRIMHESGADLTVSIHMNKFRDGSVRGPMVFFTKDDEPSEHLAQHIMQSLCDELSLALRHTNHGDYYVIRNSEIPAVIVECGFLSNAEEEKLLCTDEYRSRIAHAVADGICSFVSYDDSIKNDGDISTAVYE